MKKVTFSFIIVVFILIFGLISLAQGLPSLTESSPTPPLAPPTTNTAPPPLLETSSNTINTFSYTDPACSFSFNFPDKWKEYEEVKGTLKAEFDFWEEKYILSSFFVYVKDTDLSLSQYAIEEEEWMMNLQNMPDYKKISEEAINVGSLPAIQRRYTYTFIGNNNTKIPIKAIDVYIVSNNKSYMLVGEVDQDKFDKMLDDLAIMFNSFVITEKPVSVSTTPELPPGTISDTSSISPALSTSSETTFNFCPYCGTPMQPDYKFCPGCGKPVAVQRAIKVAKEEESRSNRRNNIDYPVNPLQTRGFSEEMDRIVLENDSNLFPASLGSRISSLNLVNRSASPTNFNFSYIEELGRRIAVNPNLGITYRGGGINQFASSLKNLREGMGDYFSDIGKGINPEMGIKREGESLPSLTPTVPQTSPQTIQTIAGNPPPVTAPQGIVGPTPGAPAQGGITLTPPGQLAPAQSGPGGIALPTPGTPQEPQIIWKQYSLNQAFSHNPLITGYLEYPSTWLVNLDAFNRNVTFSEDASGLTSLTLFPGLMGQFSSAQDLAQQMTDMLQQQVPDLSILNQEFKIVPTPGSGAIEVTEGKINLQGSYQGAAFRFNIETYVIYTGVYGPSSGMGYVILTQSPLNIFISVEQKYFNRMLLSYKRALGIEK